MTRCQKPYCGMECGCPAVLTVSNGGLLDAFGTLDGYVMLACFVLDSHSSGHECLSYAQLSRRGPGPSGGTAQ